MGRYGVYFDSLRQRVYNSTVRMDVLFVLRTPSAEYSTHQVPGPYSPAPLVRRLTYTLYGHHPPINGCYKEYAGRRSPCSTITKKAQWWPGGHHLRLFVQDRATYPPLSPILDMICTVYCSKSRFVVGVGYRIRN